MSHGFIHLTLGRNDRMLNGIPKCCQGRKLCGTVRVLQKSCTSCSSAKMDLCLTIPCQLVQWPMASITAHSCRIRWGWLFTINNQNCLIMVSFCSMTMQQSLPLWFAKSGATLGLRGVGTSSLLPDLTPYDYWLFAHVKEHLQGKGFKSEDNINIALAASLQHRARMNTELQFNIYHIDGKSVWTVLVITLCRGHMCNHSGISVVLSCMLLAH